MHPDYRAALWLVMNGVPYDVAFSLDSVDQMAHMIAIGELHGNEWEFNSWRWKDRT